MNRRQLLHFFLAGAALPWPLDLLAAEQVTKARSWCNSNKLRLVLDLSGPLEYRTFELDAPQRFIVDLHNARLNTSLVNLTLAGSPVLAIRSGAHGEGTRLVFDLIRPVELKSFVLAPAAGAGHRLVLDLEAKAQTNATQLAHAEQSVAKGRDIIVVIDAGHGGKDPGAIGTKGEQEKVEALAIARQLAQKINRQRGFTAHLVRNNDVFIPLRKRVELARRHNADMFISVHADAAPRKTASGASVFALSQGGATSTTARWMAQRENSADLIGAKDLLSLKDKDPMLAGVILDMSLTSTIDTSLDLGKAILNRVGKVAGMHQKRVEQAGFAVLKSPDIPSILVETGFISNADDCRKLVDALHQQKLADAIFSGLHEHFQKSPPQGTLLASQKEARQV